MDFFSIHSATLRAMTSPPYPTEKLTLVSPPPVKPGDRVAMLSPSWAGPAVYPDVHDVGLQVIREEFLLETVEYPTTRRLDASAKDRARDLMDAFSDDSIAAVMTSIGGDDQLTVLPHLDRDVFVAHPKRFFGFSDNTNSLNYLWNLGIVSYHGSSTMIHLARAGGVHPISMESLRSALFTNDTVELKPVDGFTDLTPEWSNLSTLDSLIPTTNESGWHWHNADHVVTGPTWGGNLEILHWNLAANRWILPVDAYSGCVLLLETSEEMPPSEEVFRMLRNFGERGLLQQFLAVVVAKPKAWSHERMNAAAAREAFRNDQRDAVLQAVDAYNPTALVVIGPDFGHTDPQYVIPYGGQMTVDGPARCVTMTY
jgi:muramoyltetrapeptide carboxypeptidase LdcA involved in peptidoglycan recycling